MNNVKVEVLGVYTIVDPFFGVPTGDYIIVLQDETGHQLHIWTGTYPVQAILFELKGDSAPRPLSHQLYLKTIQELGGEVLRIEVDDLREEIFYASIYLSQAGREVKVGARPSDAILLALTAKAPVFVADWIMKKHGSAPEQTDQQGASEPHYVAQRDPLQPFRDFIGSLDPDD